MDSEVVTRGIRFLLASVREDGSWPIDTNLATWLTTLAVNALPAHGKAGPTVTPSQRVAIRRWLLAQQSRSRHPLTFGAAGGWAWSDGPGAMPDADDTAGVLLALRRLGPPDAGTVQAALNGIRWLLAVRNADGGIPTFARGWGRLPFDRSCPDITAHALRAFVEWRADCGPGLRVSIDRAVRRGIAYLERTQDADGYWVPLWFGHQLAPAEENRTYGTAQCVMALRELVRHGHDRCAEMVERASKWLVSAQNADGGWGGAAGVPSSIEETALAVTALAGGSCPESVSRGASRLVEQTQGGTRFDPAPIGLYFARLWYSEKLYPLIFAVRALRAVAYPASDAGL
jgi:squalene-hopene/tetraprenyl-beta-curcumene cyclase